MQTPRFIHAELPEDKALDFNFLYEEGLKRIQELTGAFWTDYNPHDPGVTILEQLCYAITDIAYRANLPIQDLLHTREGEPQIFYGAADILTNAPFTLTDFRKVLIDEIPELVNVWLYPVETEEFSLRGLLVVYADVARSYNDEEKTRLMDKIRRVFSRYRNLSQDIDHIIIHEPQEFTLSGEIEIDDTQEPERIVADICFAIKQLVTPDICFYSLAEMRQAGKGLEEIFTGPKLKHGFLREEDLADKITQLPVADVVKILMQVSGVVSVKNIALQNLGEAPSQMLRLAPHESLHFHISPTAPAGDLKFTKGGLPFRQMNGERVMQYYTEQQAAKRRVYRVANHTLEMPQGNALPLDEYYSVQHHFPIVYGIGTEGIPNAPDTLRKAQAKQLKGYLLFFEQILANYLAQVAQVNHLLVPDTRDERSYFSQLLTNVPDVEPLLIRNTEPPQYLNDVIFARRDFVPNDYYEGVAKILALQDNYESRKQAFLDFQLAVYGENYAFFESSQKQFYPDASSFARYLLKSKNLLLSKLAELQPRRACAFDYTERVPSFSGFETSLYNLLGLQLPPYRAQLLPADDIPNTWRITDVASAFALTLPVEAAFIEEYFDYLDESDAQETLSDTDLIQAIGARWEWGITPAAFRAGQQWENYKIGQTDAEGNHHLVLWQGDAWYYVGVYAHYEQAFAGAQALLQSLRTLNAHYEQLYTLEHILLRPAREASQYGLYVVNSKAKPMLKSTARYPFVERQALVATLEPYLYDWQYYSVERRTDGNFEMEFTAPIENLKLKSLDNLESVQSIHQQMEELFEFIANKRLRLPYSDKIAYYIQINDQEAPIHEEFFNHQMTLILPSWTLRFSQPEFRQVFRQLVREQLPAHIACEVLWLDATQLHTFEQAYYTWYAAKQAAPNQDPQAEREQLLKTLMTIYAKR